MNRNLRLLAATGVAALAVALAVALAACGDDEEEEAAAPTATTAAEEPTATEAAGTTPEPGEEATTLPVELNEFSIAGEGGAALASVPAGEVTFEASNLGQIAHELVVIKTDTDPAQLPKSDGDADEDAAGQVIGEIEEFPAGEVETGTFVLEAGTYALICNIPDHYESGMYAQLTVE